MKSLQEFILNESLNQNDLRSIERLLEKIIHVGSPQEYQLRIYDKNNNGKYCKEINDILDKYDDYMDNIMWDAISGIEMPAVLAKKIQKEAEDNERKNGTESNQVIEFLKELINFLNI